MSEQKNYRYCPKCGQMVDNDMSFCPICGTTVPQIEEPKTEMPPISAEQAPVKKLKKWPFIVGGIAAVVIVAVVVILTTVCFHDWHDATCTKASWCTKCGKTRGESDGHFPSDATCTEGEVCTVCGKTFSDPLGHSFGDWETTIESTCTKDGEKQRSCERCDETETEELSSTGHTAGSWEITKEATAYSDGEKVKKCTKCDEVLDTETFELTSYHTDDGFVFTASEFLKLLGDEFDAYGSSYYPTIWDDDGDCSITVWENNKLDGVICDIFFAGTDGDIVPYTNRDKTKVGALAALLPIDDNYIQDLFIPLAMACDPTLNSSEASDLYVDLTAEVITSGTSTGDVFYNGIEYYMEFYDTDIVIMVSVD